MSSPMFKLTCFLCLFIFQITSCRNLKGAICRTDFSPTQSCSFKSEGYGLGVPDSTSCLYTIQSDPNSVTKLSFTDFSIDSIASVKIFDGADETACVIGSLNNRTNHIHDYLTTGQFITVQFVTPKSNAKGFTVNCQRSPKTFSLAPTASGEFSSNSKLDLSNAVYKQFQATFDLKIPPTLGDSMKMSNISCMTKGVEPKCSYDNIKIKGASLSKTLCGSHPAGEISEMDFLGESHVTFNLTLASNTETDQRNQYFNFNYDFYKNSK